MTGTINSGSFDTRFKEQDYLEVYVAAKAMRTIKETLTDTQKQLLAGCNEDGINQFNINWDEPDESEQLQLWDRLDARLGQGHL